MKKLLAFNIFIGIVIAAVAVVIVVGLYVSGSPSQERARRLDETRINQMQQITFAIESFANGHGQRLPSNLDELKNSSGVYIESIMDPASGNEYEYQTSGTSTYSLCATFATDSSSQSGGNGASAPAIYPQYAGFWNHPAGHACFTLQYTPTQVPQPKPLTIPAPPAANK